MKRRPLWKVLALVLVAGCAPDPEPIESDEPTDDQALGDDDDDDDDDDTDSPTTPPECGNGVVESPEVCDDGNMEDDDGCAADCFEKRIQTDLGIAATTYDLGRDNSGAIYLLFKDGDLSLGHIEASAVVDIEEIDGTRQMNTRYTRPRLAVAPDGSTVHTSWFQGTPGEEVQHTWRNANGNWEQEVAWRSGGLEYAAVPVVGVDLDGTVHMIAQKWWYNGFDQDESTIMRLQKPAGGSWSGAEDIHSEAGKNWRDTSMFVDSSGGVHATWKSYARPGKYRYAQSGTDLIDGMTLDIAAPAGENTTSFGDSFVGEDGSVHHAFFTYPNQELCYSVLPSGGVEFGVSAQISSADNDEHTGYENPWPGIAVDSDGRVFVVWAENRGLEDVPYVVLATLSEGMWTLEELDASADIDPNSKPAITAFGKDVYIVWRTGDGTLRLLELAISGS